MLTALPLGMMAQEDDAYFVPSKAKKKAAQEQYQRDLEERAEQQRLQYERLHQLMNQIGEGDFYVDEYEGEGVPDYHIGKLRNEDEYNRRGIKNYATVVNGKDTLYYDEEMDLEATTRAEVNQRNQEYADEMDYGYVDRLVRFHGGLASRYYWDYNYSWAYDPFYRWGWTYDPWYWDYFGPSWAYYPNYYGWGFGYYGYHGYGYYSLYSPWYNPWYHGYYYGPGYWHGNSASYSHRPTSSRRSNSLAGVSASRGTRGSSLAGTSSGRGASASRPSSTASRGTGYRTTTATQRNDGRLTTNRTTTSTANRTATTSSRNTTTTQRSTSTSTTSRSNTSTTTSRTQSYTPTTTTSSSSRGGSFSSSSSSSSGGGFSSGGGASRSSGGGGSGRGGR